MNLNDPSPTLFRSGYTWPWRPAARAALPLLAYFCLHLAIYLHFGPQFNDDAFITFRYAERLAQGHGFTFNDGAPPVLGTTTPLWTLLLAGARRMGLGLVTAVALFSALGAAVFCEAGRRLMARLDAPLLGVLFGPTLLLYDLWLWSLLMGMETMLYMALLALTLERITAARPITAGLIGALAALTRPDGALALLLALGVAWHRNGRTGLRATALATLILLPWLIYAALSFGAVIPHSVEAKQFIHPAGFFEAAGAAWILLYRDAFGRIALGLAAVGLIVVALRRRRAWTLPAWIAAYALGLAASGVAVQLFPWYVTPLAGMVWLLATLALAEAGHLLAERLTSRPFGLAPRTVATLLCIGLWLVIVAQSSGFWRRNGLAFPIAYTYKERIYADLARQLRPRLAPGTRVLVGEVGIFGYLLPDGHLIDSAGLNSPRILELRRQDPKGGRTFYEQVPDWLRAATRRMRPDYIISLGLLIGGNQILSDPEALPAYDLVEARPVGTRQHLLILRRQPEQGSPAKANLPNEPAVSLNHQNAYERMNPYPLIKCKPSHIRSGCKNAPPVRPVRLP